MSTQWVPRIPDVLLSLLEGDLFSNCIYLISHRIYLRIYVYLWVSGPCGFRQSRRLLAVLDLRCSSTLTSQACYLKDFKWDFWMSLHWIACGDCLRQLWWWIPIKTIRGKSRVESCQFSSNHCVVIYGCPDFKNQEVLKRHLSLERPQSIFYLKQEISSIAWFDDSRYNR